MAQNELEFIEGVFDFEGYAEMCKKDGDEISEPPAWAMCSHIKNTPREAVI